MNDQPIFVNAGGPENGPAAAPTRAGGPGPASPEDREAFPGGPVTELDQDLTSGERATVLALLEATGRGGLLAERVRLVRGQFGWARSEDFYAGYARALMAAAQLCRQNRHADHTLLAGILLLHTGVVVQHLERT